MGGGGCGVVPFLTKQFVNKILFGGNLGKVFDMDWEPYFGPQLALENFSHLMTVTSGGVEVSCILWTSFCTAYSIPSVFPE